MITTIAKLTAAEGKADEMRAALETMVAAVDANEPGVSVYSLHTVADEPNVFYFYEQYDDAEAQESHGKTDHMAVLGGALREISGGRPKIIRCTQIAGVTR